MAGNGQCVWPTLQRKGCSKTVAKTSQLLGVTVVLRICNADGAIIMEGAAGEFV